MRHIIISAMLFSCALSAVAQGITSSNRELSRPVFMSYRNTQSALRGEWSESENYSPLSGEWFVKWFDNPRHIDTMMLKTNAVTSDLKKITLPAAFRLQGVGGEAIFAEKAYTFLKDSPLKNDFAKPRGGAALLMRDFSVPFDYLDKAVFFHIGAASAAVTLYINGVKVGYSTDSRNPAEFDITKYIVRGRNRAALVVDEFCDGSYLEDQTGWRLGGVNREIYLFAQPKIRVRDYTVRTTLDPTYKNGLLETALLLKTQLLNPHTVTVYYDLYDPDGNLVNQAQKDVQIGMRYQDTVRFTATILDVKQWSDETPNLYTILYRIKRDTKWSEFIAVKSGFRTVEIKDGRLLVNGKAPKIKGVNLAEFSPSTGNVQSKEDIEKVLKQIKERGFNAIRTDGYPLQNYFYELCDRMGLYVWDVANINAQGIGTSIYKGRTLANDPAWRDEFIFRVDNTYQRNKAHTSVIMWGLGDNAGNGYNMYEAYLMLKAQEQTRPIAYNGAGLEFNSDIFCPDNFDLSKLAQIKPIMDGQPVILSRCTEAVWDVEGVQGGFLTRWQSPAISAGGKFARLSDDYRLQQLGSGKVELPNAESFDLGKRPVVVREVKRGVYEFENNLQFANLKDINIDYQIIQKGKVKESGRIAVDVAPGERGAAKLKIPILQKISKAEIVIRVGYFGEFRF
ncbi:Beta-galactosidase [Mucinivorans hirudinis]|uniref:beta-galactosidase n=1 Tax=Mucinivorans hirudinis TaxID=1433126 RepID=A0A060R7C3_9BACT|nr:Beta-galactosidase [Mucinivorans hirudinis]